MLDRVGAGQDRAATSQCECAEGRDVQVQIRQDERGGRTQRQESVKEDWLVLPGEAWRCAVECREGSCVGAEGLLTSWQRQCRPDQWVRSWALGLQAGPDGGQMQRCQGSWREAGKSCILLRELCLVSIVLSL